MSYTKTNFLSFFFIILLVFACGFLCSKKTKKLEHQIHAFFQTRTKKQMEKDSFINFKSRKDTLHEYFSSIIDLKYQKDPNFEEYLLDFPIDDYSVINVHKKTNFFINLNKDRNDCIKKSLISNTCWENHLIKLMKRHVLPKTIILDIGAHIGTHTISFARWAEDGVVYSFEPQPKIFRELFYNLAINNITNVKLFKCAVGSKNGETELSPLAEDNEGGTGIHGGSGYFTDIITIDSLNLNNVSLIKIDVEGMEDNVLEGARETIIKNKPIIFIEFTGCDIINTKDEKIRNLAMEKISRLEQMGYFIQNISSHDYIAYPFRKNRY